MDPLLLLVVILLLLSTAAFQLGRWRAFSVAQGEIRQLHSLPRYYGYLAVLWCTVPALLVLVLWLFFEDTVLTYLVVAELPENLRQLPPNQLDLVINDIKNLVTGNIVSGEVNATLQNAADHYRSLKQTSTAALAVVVLSLAVAGMALTWYSIQVKQRARNKVEGAIGVFLIASSTIAILTTIGILLSVLFEAIRFFQAVPVSEFLFGLEWSPQMAIREDQVDSSGAFGAVPLFTGTLLISAIAMLVAVSIGLMSAIYLSEYASRRVRTTFKPLLEILAGIPAVVYGFFAALISETIRQVVIPAALPGIVGSILLAVSRAIGETMIVVMAAGLSANLTANPLEVVTTVTVQIVTVLVGDQEFDGPKTLATFALGLVLFIVTLCLNMVALYIVRTYREQYE